MTDTAATPRGVTMTRISEPFATALTAPGFDPATVWDAIVVGSGYGGAISAWRLTAAGQKVLLLERGREILPGEYPRTLQEAIAETQISTAEAGRLTTANGLLDLRINDDMSVVLGCGLGGTSLLNASVSLAARPAVFAATEDGPDGFAVPVWPAAYLPGSDGALPLQPWYDTASILLRAMPYPLDWPALPKMRGLARSAEAFGKAMERPPIAVTFKSGKNAFGNEQPACTLCGDCCSGCNYGSKNTTLMTFLPQAQANGARLLTEAQVHDVAEGANGIWEVRTTAFGAARDSGIDLKARLVVLGAGTLGSTEILQRSAARGLAVATRWLGQGFSGNGDVLGFGMDANVTHTTGTDAPPPLYSIGAGAKDPDPADPSSRPGPCITAMIRIDMGPDDPVRDGVLIEDGVAPGPLSMAYPAIFFGDTVTTASMTRFPDAARRLADIAALGNGMQNMQDMAYAAPMTRMQSYLLMSHDSAGGKIVYDAGQDMSHVVWPGAGHGAPFDRDNALLRKAADAIWASYLPNPVWSDPFGWKVVTTHPIGGCRMGDNPTRGVIDPDCRVYTGHDGDVHEGLMVCDGAAIPGSLGVNPLLTISAVTLRAMDRLIARRGWTVKAALAPAASSRIAGPPPDVPDPVPGLIAAVKPVRDWLADAGARIAAGQGAAVVTEIADWLRGFADGYSGLRKAALRLAIDAAEAAVRLDREADLGRAINTLAKDFETLLTALVPDPPQPESGAIARFEAALAQILGDLTTGLSFEEAMQGWVAPAGPDAPHPLSDPYATAARDGQAEGWTMDCDYRVVAGNAGRLLTDPAHAAALSGTLRLADPATGRVSAHAMHDGRFELLPQDPDRIDTWHMIYTARLDDGRDFRGIKTLNRRPGSDWWTDLTTLSVDVTGAGKPALRGMMKLSFADLVKQSQTIGNTLGGTEGVADLILALLRETVAGQLNRDAADPDFLNRFARTVLAHYAATGRPLAVAGVRALDALTDARGAAFFANLIFRTYGGMPAYLSNFAAADARTDAVPDPDGGRLHGTDIRATAIRHITTDRANLRLTRFRGGPKGPVIVANGFGFSGLAFAMATNPTSLVAELAKAGFDVFVFDHRASPAGYLAGNQPLSDYTMDTIAAIDWPWAVDQVIATRAAEGAAVASVQMVVHCLGGLTAMMALQGGHVGRVRQMVVSQFTTQPVAGWFNQMKADLHLATLIRDGVGEDLAAAIAGMLGMPALQSVLGGQRLFDLRGTTAARGTPTAAEMTGMMIDSALWQVPFPQGESCYSPTCHRIFGVFGPVYAHARLNQATHDALTLVAGPVATAPFAHLALMMQQSRAVAADGSNVYFNHPERLDFPIHFISGALNQLVLPETTLRSLRWLQGALPGSARKFTREVLAGYGHLDCLIGRDAGKGAIASILRQLVPLG